MSISLTSLNNRYTVAMQNKESFLGQGGMGTVYKGVDSTTNQAVAIKILKPELVGRDPELLRRFRLEGEALRQLNHPNIVKMLDATELDGVHYLIMEYVSGGSLRDVLESHPRLSVQRTLYTALDIADALTRAHRLRILHRDIKPDNVLIAEDGTPRLTDFGMARMNGSANNHITQDGAIVGTMAYLAPEAFHGEEPDERTDIWAFGIMLYEMLAGERPFPHQQAGALINAIMTQQLPDLETIRRDVPIALIDLIYRMLTKDRQARIPSVRLIGAELEALIRGGSLESTMQAVVNVEESTGRFEISTGNIPGIDTSTQRAPNNLSHQPTHFVGRERQLQDLGELVNSGAALVTLVGVGGVGKTRIALQFAEKQLSRFTDGVYFVAMAGLEQRDYIIPTIGEALGFSFGTDPKNDLLNYLREKRMLLIIDNFEHLIESAELLAEIIAAAPHVVVIVTSRERLRLRGEQIYEVEGMRIPSKADETPEKMMTFAAAQLFVQSAHRVQADFTIDSEQTSECVAQVIRLVGGLPLGIELAAAWLEALSIHEIELEIEKSLDFLETDLRDVPERHRSIRAVFEYSWNLMSPEEQAVFLKLSVFRGGFEREAAQKVAGASLKNLTNLVNKSLLSRDPNGRYYVQKLLRQYSDERLKEMLDVKMATYKAHAEYYASFIAKLAPAINTSKENAAFDAIDAELENINLMWMKVVGHGFYDVLYDGIDALTNYYLARSLFEEGWKAFDELAKKLKADGREDAFYWRVRNRQGWIDTRRGLYDRALEFAQGAYAYFATCDNCIEIAHALNQISYVHMMRGNYEESKAAARKSLEGITVKTNQVVWFIGMGNLGYAHYLSGELREAREIYENLSNTRELDDYSPTGEALGKNNLGEILRDMGEMNRALELFKEAYATFEASNQKRGMAFTLNNIGGVVFMQGNYEESKSYYERSYALNREIGNPTGLAHSLSALGNVAMTVGDMALSEKKYKESLAIRRGLGDKSGTADSLSDLAYTYMQTGRMADALTYVEESLQIRREIGDKRGQAYDLTWRGFAYVLQGHYEQARPDIQEGLQLAETVGLQLATVQGYIASGVIAFYADKDYATALTWFKKALAAYDIEQLPMSFILLALLGIAEIREKREDYAGALALVSLIQRYPAGFLTFIEGEAKQLYERLAPKLPQETVTSTVTIASEAVLKQVIQDILKD